MNDFIFYPVLAQNEPGKMEIDINYLCIGKIFNIYQEKVLGVKTFSFFKVTLL